MFGETVHFFPLSLSIYFILRYSCKYTTTHHALTFLVLILPNVSENSVGLTASCVVSPVYINAGHKGY